MLPKGTFHDVAEAWVCRDDEQISILKRHWYETLMRKSNIDAFALSWFFRTGCSLILQPEGTQRGYCTMYTSKGTARSKYYQFLTGYLAYG